MDQEFETLWDSLYDSLLNHIKIHVLKFYPQDILISFGPKLNYVVKQYSRYLPSYVAENELDDLKIVAQLELFESIKNWNPEKNKEIWPLAYQRIVGAMKDHIRYITKSDPSRFYEWVSDAAYLYLTVNKRADFEQVIENGLQLNEALEVLTLREKKIVIGHAKNDLTFSEIARSINISESQVSRIYKKAIEKVRKHLIKIGSQT